jgi:hypothetical protein
MVEGLPGLKGPDIPIGHKIIVRSVPMSGQLIAYVEILGVLRVGGLFADARGPVDLVEHIYAYDVLGKQDRSDEFTIDASEFERQDWKQTGVAPTEGEQLRALMAEAIQATFETRYRSRFAEASSGQEVLGKSAK